MKKLLIITAITEAGTGLGLLAAPAIVARLVLGATLVPSAALTVARVDKSRSEITMRKTQRLAFAV